MRRLISFIRAVMMELERVSKSGPTPSPAPADMASLVAAALTLAIVVTVVAILFFLREILIPLTLAVLLSFVLAPAVRLLQRCRVPRGVAAVLVVLFAFGVISALGTLMAAGVRDLANDLPRYETVLRDKIQTLRGMTAGSRTLDQAASVLQDLSSELQGPAAGAGQKPGASARPVPVEVRQPDAGPLATLSALIAPLLNPLATTGVIVVFVVFILVQREDLRDRLIRLTGARDLGRTTAAIDDAARRLSRFYLTQLGLNAGFGLVMGLGLWAIGVPSAALWGILAAVLRFVPYVGSVISAVFPLALAAAVEPGWSMLIKTAVMVAVAEGLVGQVIEPLVYGHSTGLSPIAVVVSATFWTWLWGPIGLVLATPLTVCLVVLGRHVERLRFLEVMFGDRPALSPPEIFYQRMLAGDPAEAVDHAESFLRQRSLVAYYETVALAGLRRAQDDLADGLLDESQTERVRDAAMEVVAELAGVPVYPKDQEDDGDVEAEAAVDAADQTPVPRLTALSPDEAPQPWREPRAVLTLGGQSALDDAAARLAADLVARHGLPTAEEPHDALRGADLFGLDLTQAQALTICFLDVGARPQMRLAVRKLRRKAPGATIVLAAFGLDPQAADKIARDAGADAGAGTLAAAADAMLRAARGTLPPAAANKASASTPPTTPLPAIAAR